MSNWRSSEMRRPPEAGTSFRRPRDQQVQSQVWVQVRVQAQARPELPPAQVQQEPPLLEASVLVPPQPRRGLPQPLPSVSRFPLPHPAAAVPLSASVRDGLGSGMRQGGFGRPCRERPMRKVTPLRRHTG